MKKQFIYYHDPCLDGMASAFLVKLFEGQDTSHFEGLSYSAKQKGFKFDFEQWEAEASRVLFVDFVPNKSDLIEIWERSIPHLIIDHHKTAIDEILKLQEESGVFLNTYLSRDNKKSGVGLVMQWYTDLYYSLRNLPPLMEFKFEKASEYWRIFKHVQDRDLWSWKYPETEAVTEALWSYETSLDSWDELFKREDLYENLKIEGASLNRFKKKTVDLTKRSVSSIQVGPYMASIVNSNVFQSEIGNSLCKESGIDFAIVWAEDKYGVKRCSLRSEDNFDCSKIAKFFGGGGHAQAAGCAVKSLDQFKEYSE